MSQTDLNLNNPTDLNDINRVDFKKDIKSSELDVKKLIASIVLKKIEL